MAWIESHQSLACHRKTSRMARRLKITKVQVIGHMHLLWWWCIDNAESGHLAGIDIEDISDAASWVGDPADFFDALLYSEFVDGPETDYYVHDWFQYSGKLIEQRKKDAERKRLGRTKDVVLTSGGHPSDNVKSIGHPTDGGQTADVQTNRPTDRQTDSTNRQTDQNRAKARPNGVAEIESFLTELSLCPEYAGGFGRFTPNVMAGKMWNFYESNGWKVGKAAMKDWKAAFRGWVGRERDEHPAVSRNGFVPSVGSADDILALMGDAEK